MMLRHTTTGQHGITAYFFLIAVHPSFQSPLLGTRRATEPGETSGEDEEDDAEDDAEDEKKDKEAMTRKKLITKAVLMLLAGTIVCAVFSDPMVDAVSNFSTVGRSRKFSVLDLTLSCSLSAAYE